MRSDRINSPARRGRGPCRASRPVLERQHEASSTSLRATATSQRICTPSVDGGTRHSDMPLVHSQSLRASISLAVATGSIVTPARPAATWAKRHAIRLWSEISLPSCPGQAATGRNKATSCGVRHRLHCTSAKHVAALSPPANGNAKDSASRSPPRWQTKPETRGTIVATVTARTPYVDQVV